MSTRRLVWFSFLLANCGEGAPADSPRALCEAVCDRAQLCQSNGGESRDECLAGCVDSAPPASIFKPGVLSGLAGCMSQLACESDDDACVEQVGAALDPSGQQELKVDACVARQEACAGSSGGSAFDASRCASYLLCTTETMAAVDACLAGACESIDACLGAVLGAAGSSATAM